MNMFIHELRAYRKSTIIWTCSICAVAIIFLSIYPGFSRDADEFMRLIRSYPEVVLKAMGLSGDISSLLYFYSFVFLYIMLCGAVQAMNIGISIISKEIRNKTADFLLTKPVSRVQVITSKLLAAAASLVITNIVYLITACIMAGIVQNGDFRMDIFIMISLILFFIQMMFLSLGVIVAVVVSKIRSVVSVSLGTVFGFFIINMFGSVLGDEALRYITPFKYFDTAYIIKNGGYESPFAILSIAIVAAFTAASYLLYSRRDIHAV